MLIAAALSPRGVGPTVLMFVIVPLLYLLFGYVMALARCALYNALVKYIGGIEYETRTSPAERE